MNYITVKAPPGGRGAYSVVPDPDDPIILQLDGKLVRVLDVSANGLTSPPGVVTAGRRYPFVMDLPTANVPLTGYVDVLPGSESEPLNCRFVDLSPEELDLLHRYVLVRQKEAIRSIRAGRLS